MKTVVLAAAAIVIAPAAALAQVGAPLLMEPWLAYGPGELPDEARLQVSEQVILQRGADIDGTAEDVGIWQLHARGRFKLTDQPGAGPAIGYDVLYIDLHSGDAALPDRLVDAAVSGGFGVSLNDDWDLGVVVGAGYAGTRPFADGDSVYGLADLILAREIDEYSSITFNLNYRGNRSVLPDVPLPAISYGRRSQRFPGLRYIVGFPFASIVYTPDDHWELSASYAAPYTFEARVGYNVTHQLQLFGTYDSFTRGFWLEDVNNRRVFFSQRRVEAGVRYSPVENVSLVLAGGYAFDQEFEVGWDMRSTDTVRDIDDTPFVRLGLDVAW